MNRIVDTLKLTEALKSVGFADPQARALAAQFHSRVDDHLVTKESLDFKLKELRYGMTLSMGGFDDGHSGLFQGHGAF